MYVLHLFICIFTIVYLFQRKLITDVHFPSTEIQHKIGSENGGGTSESIGITEDA